MRTGTVGLFIWVVFAGLAMGLLFPGNLSAEDPAMPLSAEGENVGGQTLPAAEMTDIHDIKAPAFLTFNPAWIWYGLLFLLCVILIALVVWLLKRRKRAGDPEKTIPKIPPEETAYGLLKGILPLLESDGRKFYFSLSAVIRGYIQDRFGMNALEMTSEELVPEIRGLDVDPSLKDGLMALFHAGDPVKFAGMAALRIEMERHYEFVHDFIKNTTPVPATPEAGGSDASGENI